MAASTAKQYLCILDKTILEHTLAAFISHPKISEVVVVLHPSDVIFNTLNIAKHPRVCSIIGGKERADSVLAGLQFLSSTKTTDTYALIHDGARPCIDPQDISRLIIACTDPQQQNGVCGAILACPIIDTVKQAKSSMLARTIEQTIDRSLLWQAQTPQMFKINELIHAIELAMANNITITDEASAMENMHKEVMLIEGHSSNLKITKPSDLALAEFYLRTKNN